MSFRTPLEVISIKLYPNYINFILQVHCRNAVKAPPYEYCHFKLIFFYYIISLINRILLFAYSSQDYSTKVNIMCLFQLKIFKVNYL